MGFNLLKNQGKGIFKGLEGEEIQLYLKSLASFHASTHHMTQIEGGVKKILDAYPSLERINLLKEDILAVMHEKIILGERLHQPSSCWKSEQVQAKIITNIQKIFLRLLKSYW